MVGDQKQEHVPLEMHLPLEKEKLVSEVVARLVQKGAVSPLEAIPGEFISQLFTVPQSDGRLRPVINPKVLKRCIKDYQQRGEFRMVKDLVKQGYWM